jgi:amino acid permease
MSVPRDSETERLLLGDTETHTRHETPTHRATNPSFPRVFYKRHLFSIMFNQVVGLAFYVTAGTVLRTGGQAPMILSLLFLGLLVVLVNRDVVQMLRAWPISTSLVIFVQSFIDPHLGIVIGWLSWMKLCCWLALLMVEIVSLAETLGMNRVATFAVKATMVAMPVLFNLMDTRWFTWFQMWLTAIKSVALTAVFSIMLYVNLFAAQQEHQLVSREDKVFVGNGLAETFRGLVFAMYMFCSAFIGVETLSMVAPEVIRREKGEEEV